MKYILILFEYNTAKNKIVKITNLFCCVVARNSGNCNLIGLVIVIGCYRYTCNYNPIIVILISLRCLIDIQRSRINILIESL